MRLSLLSFALLLATFPLLANHLNEDDAIRYRKHISGPISPVNRQLTQRQKETSRLDDSKGPTAGSIGDWQLELGTAWTWIRDKQLADDAVASEFYVHASAAAGDTQLGLSLAHDTFETDSTDITMKTLAADFFAMQPVHDNFEIGFLTIIAESEIKAGPQHLLTVGAGPVVAAHATLGSHVAVGATSSVNWYKVDTGYDTLFTVLLDVNYSLNDTWALYGYGQFNDSLRSNYTDDRSFWTLGAQLNWRPTDRISLAAGYETTAGFIDYSDHTIVLSATWSF